MKKNDIIKNKKILLITRSYPPTVGGMEKLSFNIINYLKPHCETYTIINKFGRKNIPFFIIYALIKSLFIAKKVDVVHIGDSVLAIVGFFIKTIYKKPIIYSVHGLDILYPNKYYQLYLKLFFVYDKLICISKYTESLVRQAGHNKTVIVPLGIDKNNFIINKELDKEKVLNIFKIPTNKKILLTVGRLVKRKGVAWFIDNVMPRLPSEIIYVVVGQGELKAEINQIITKNKLEGRVFLLGQIKQQHLDDIYQISKVFIMSNITVEGDAEGFGYVALEASAWGLPVLTSGIEGIVDAVIDEKNGKIIKGGYPDEYIKIINQIFQNEVKWNNFRQNVRNFTLTNYDWEIIIKTFYNQLVSTIKYE